MYARRRPHRVTQLNAPTKKSRILLIQILTMVVVAATVTGLAIIWLYNTAVDEMLADFQQDAITLANTVDSLADDGLPLAGAELGAAQMQVLTRLERGWRTRTAHAQRGEMLIGRIVGNEVVIVSLSEGQPLQELARLPATPGGATAMQRALAGQRGSGLLDDYRNQRVLAGYALAPRLQLGVVHKLSLAEMRRPFIVASVWLAMLATVLVLLGAVVIHWLSERLNAQVRRDKARLDNLLDASPVGVYETDLGGNNVMANRRWYEISGLDEAQTRGRGWMQALHPDDAAKVDEAWRAFVAGRQPYRLEYRLGNPTRGWRWVFGEATPMHDSDGSLVGYTGTVTDIDDQVRARAALRRGEQRLNEAQRLAQLGSWELDLVSGALHWSAEIYRIFEIDPLRFGATYEAFLNAIHPDDREAVNAAYTNSLATRAPYRITHRLLLSDGRVKWVEERCESVFDADGKALLSTGTVQDITRIKEAELRLDDYRSHLEELVTERSNELAESNRMLRTVIDTAPFAIFWKDREGRFLGGNRLLAADAGMLSAAPMIGLTDYDMPWRATAERYRNDDLWVMDNDRPRLGFEEPMDLPDGSRLWLATSKVPLHDKAGKVVGVLGTYHDITARKLAESELVAAKEQAEASNRAKSEFLSRMSHELRTPLNAILGFAQVLEMSRLDGRHLDGVREIHHAGRHLLNLIDELLDMSRIESGRLQLRLEPVAVAELVDAALGIVSPLIAAHRIGVQRENIDGWSVLADANRLRQILVNLLSNAAKYNRTGGSIHIQCCAVAADRLRIQVRDTGIGIPPQRLGDLFTPFERLGAEYSEVEGTGIGLTLSRELARLMQGDIGVESAEGRGSTFWLELPLAIRGELAVPPALTFAPAAAAGLPRTVLYIEDNPANLKVIEAMLEHLPHITLLAAVRGDRGLELAQRYAPDAILLDIHLPGMDGYAVLEALRADPATAAIPVIALSADAMPDDIQRGLEAGFRAYLTKPVVFAELAGLLDIVLSKR